MACSEEAEGKLDQRWRYGIFLGRSLSSDQNFVGLNTGEVVCARAIVRVVEGIRWAPDRIANIQMSPMAFKPGSMDRIEEDPEPQTHPDPNAETSTAIRQRRRLRVFDADVRKFGYTDSCQRCEYLRQNKLVLARGTRHTRNVVNACMKQWGLMEQRNYSAPTLRILRELIPDRASPGISRLNMLKNPWMFRQT